MKYTQSEIVAAQETLDYIKRCKEHRPKEWLNQIVQHCPLLLDAMDRNIFLDELKDALSNLFYEIEKNANDIIDAPEE